MEIPVAMQSIMGTVQHRFSTQSKVWQMFETCFTNTLNTTIKPQADGTTFVITGDIPAMWLRDSAAQVRPYLLVAEQDAAMADLIEGVVNRQIAYVLHDPYANAFNDSPNGMGYQTDITAMSPLIWERKYEIDSLCYPIQLAYLLWKSTGRTTHLRGSFATAVRAIIQVWRTEQHHEEQSPYRFERTDCRPSDTLTRDGKGSVVTYTGMTWSGFRPSDDSCQYGYLVPSNMFAVVVLRYVAEIARDVLADPALESDAMALAQEIDEGIQSYAKVEHPEYGTVYAYETDGMGHYNFMDDANIPSLLSLPYLGYCRPDDPVYLNTRRLIFSSVNPYYYEGKAGRGIGSPHTPDRYVWHISMAVQGMTSMHESESIQILDQFVRTDAGTNMMHEGFDVDDPTSYTREWFSWANMMFCEFVLSLCNVRVKGSPLAILE